MSNAETEYTSRMVAHKADHPANCRDGLTEIVLRDNALSARAERATSALLALHAQAPLVLESASGCAAKLRPGWDGTIAYSCYALELAVPAAGNVRVVLRAIPPPTEPMPTSDADMAAFNRNFAARASRFPDGEEFFRWQKARQAGLAALLMGGGPPQRVALDPQTLETKDYPKFILYRVKYRTLADRANELLLSLPKGLDKAPLLLAIHGHEAGWGQADAGAFSAGHADDFCLYFAERGWCVLQPATMDHRLQHPDWTLQGEWTWDALVALDYAATVAEIDMERVGVCGLSTGAQLAMNALALDPRVKAGIVGCILSTWNHYKRIRIPPHCDCGIGPQLSPYLEQCDWAALAAPKPVQYQHGRLDAALCPGSDERSLKLDWNTGVMPMAEYETTFAELRRAYKAAGMPECVETRFHEGGHKVDNQAAFAWLNRWLNERSHAA